MKERLHIIIGILSIWLVLCTACSSDKRTSEWPVGKKQGGGSISLRIEASSFEGVWEESRAELGDGDLYQGGGMEDLVLVLVDPNGIVAEKRTYAHEESNHIEEAKLYGRFSDKRLHEVIFEGLDIGNYTIYAYANVYNSLASRASIRLEAVDEGELFSAVMGQGDNVPRNMPDDIFSPLVDESMPNQTPTIDNIHPLLLTASKVVPVDVSNTQAVVELLRPIVWFEMYVHNLTNYTLTIDALTFGKFNPTTGWVLPKEAILAENYRIPADELTDADGHWPNGATNTYRSLPPYPYRHIGSGVDEDPIAIPAHESASVYQAFLFENAAEKERYQFDMTLSIPGSISITEVQFDQLQRHNSTLVPRQNYALKLNGQNIYLADNGNGRLATVNSITNSNYLRAEWRFSGQSSGYLTNSLGRNYYGNVNAVNSGTNLTFTYQENGRYKISYTSGRNTYYLRYNNGSIQFSNTNSNNVWELYEIVTKVVNVAGTLPPLTVKDQQISYIRKDGTAAPLEEMRRNERIILNLNVSYEETIGNFKFEVEPWNPVDVPVVFN